jgi:predicted ribosome quality control (RQC) complex YloA/Tae2 family protein
LSNRKISLSSVDYLVLARELSSRLRGAWVDNVYENPDYGYYVFKFRAEGVVKKLIAIPGEAVFLTGYDYPVASRPSSSLTRLRKLIRNLRVEDVAQHDFDRIIVISFSRSGFNAKLIIEGLKKGVIVLVSGDWTILFTSQKMETGARILREGEKYDFPPSNIIDPRDVTNAGAFQGFVSERVDRFIAGKLGFGSKIMNEICCRAGLDSGSRVENKIQSIIDAARMLVKEAGESPRPRLYYSNGFPVDVSGIFLVSMREFEQKSFETLSEVLDEYYAATGFEAKKGVEKTSRELERLLKAKERMVSEASMLKMKAKTLMDNLYLFQTVLDSVKSGRGPPGEVKIVEKNYDKRIVRVLLNDVEYALEMDSSAASNASKMFEEAKKIEKHLSEIDAKILALKEVTPSRILPKKKVEEKKWYEKFRWNISANGSLILAGKEAGTNELLVKKYVGEKSIVLHADFVGAPFVTIHNVENPSQEELEEAALMAACYTTKAWEGKYASLDVYWVRGSQLSKQAPPGQYLPKGAFMVHGEKNFIRNVELKLWVGITDGGEIIYGSLGKVKAKCARYGYVVPGNKDKNEEASRLVDKLLEGRTLLRKEVARLREIVCSIIPGKHCEIHYASSSR